MLNEPKLSYSINLYTCSHKYKWAHISQKTKLLREIFNLTTKTRPECVQRDVFCMTCYRYRHSHSKPFRVTSVYVLLMLALTLWHRGPPSVQPNTFLWFHTTHPWAHPARGHWGDKRLNFVTLCFAISLTYMSGSVTHVVMFGSQCVSNWKYCYIHRFILKK